MDKKAMPEGAEFLEDLLKGLKEPVQICTREKNGKRLWICFDPTDMTYDESPTPFPGIPAFPSDDLD